MQDHPNDAAVVAQVLSGDQEEFGQLVKKHSRAVFRLAYRVTQNESDADEVVQETFLKAYRNLARFESRANFSTWLYRIAMNCSLDLRDNRQPGHSVQVVEEVEEAGEVQLSSHAPSQERVLYSKQVKRRIDGAMKELTNVERAAFVMRHMEGKSIEEISEVLNLKASAAKNSVFRAVQKMRRALEPVVAIR